MYEALISHLRECAKYDKSENTFKEAADAIEELTREYESVSKDLVDAVELCRKLKKPKWIPVTERLPESNKLNSDGFSVMYLVLWGKRIVTARRTNDWWVLITGRVLEGVTHWMPLPELPKEKT